MGTTAKSVERLFRVAYALAIVGLISYGVFDLVQDQPPLWSLHFLVETFFVLLAVAVLVGLRVGWNRIRDRLARTSATLSLTEADRELWERQAGKFLKGLNEEVEAQFARWSLTPAEREVALLLLRGFEHKECAELLGRSERTV